MFAPLPKLFTKGKRTMNQPIVHNSEEFAKLDETQRKAVLDELRKQMKQAEEQYAQRQGSALQLISLN